MFHSFTAISNDEEGLSFQRLLSIIVNGLGKGLSLE